MVQGQERVAIPGCPVADPIALPKQTSLPNDITTLHGIFQVFLLLKDLGNEKQSSVKKMFSMMSQQNSFPFWLVNDTLGNLDRLWG